MYRDEVVLLDTEFTTVITASKLTDSGSSTIKSMLIVFHLVSEINSGQSSLRGKDHTGLVCRQRSQVLMY